MHKIPAGLSAAIDIHNAMKRSTPWSMLWLATHEDSLPLPFFTSNGSWYPAVSLSQVSRTLKRALTSVFCSSFNFDQI